MNRKILTGVILGILAALMIPAVSLAATQIGTKADLLALASRVNGGDNCAGETFELTADIAVDGAWTPIGNESTPFNGTFDGKGYKVKSYTAIGLTRAGFFGEIGSSGVVMNTAFSGAVSANGVSVTTAAGGIAAVNRGLIVNCSFGGSASNAFNTGGLVGNHYGLVRNCFSTGTVNTSANGGASGGLVGEIMQPSANLQNCYSATSISAQYRGGLVGYYTGGLISNCYWRLSGCDYAVPNGSSGAFTNVYSFNDSGVLASQVGGSNVLLDVLNAYYLMDPMLTSWKAGTGGYMYPVLHPSVYEIQAVPADRDFGIMEVGYTPSVAQTCTIVNTGTGTVTITQPTAVNFTVGALSKTSLDPADTAAFTLQPKPGLGVGTYDEAIIVTGSNGTSVALQVNFSVTPLLTYTIEVSPILKNFGTAVVGYTPPGLETVTITNTGNQPVDIDQPTATNYTVGELSSDSLVPADTATFTVQPKAGLAAGTYNETITITGTNGASASLQVSFTVAAPIPYQMISGAGGTYNQHGPSGLTFRANGDFSHFTGVTVDGNPMAASNYDAREGSTIVTLHPDYLDTLAVGTHQIRILFTDGYSDATFTVGKELDPEMPPTGDNTEAAVWGMLTILCAAALALVLRQPKRMQR